MEEEAGRRWWRWGWRRRCAMVPLALAEPAHARAIRDMSSTPLSTPLERQRGVAAGRRQKYSVAWRSGGKGCGSREAVGGGPRAASVPHGRPSVPHPRRRVPSEADARMVRGLPHAAARAQAGGARAPDVREGREPRLGRRVERVPASQRGAVEHAQAGRGAARRAVRHGEVVEEEQVVLAVGVERAVRRLLSVARRREEARARPARAVAVRALPTRAAPPAAPRAGAPPRGPAAGVRARRSARRPGPSPRGAAPGALGRSASARPRLRSPPPKGFLLSPGGWPAAPSLWGGGPSGRGGRRASCGLCEGGGGRAGGRRRSRR